MIFLIGYGFLDVPNDIAFMPLKPDLMKFYWTPSIAPDASHP